MRPRPCKACAHPEAPLLDALLGQGVSPRTIVGRVGAISRRQLVLHKNACLASTGETDRRETA